MTTRSGDGIAVVTGASSGLGAEFARQLAARGWPVLAIARRGDRLEALATQARAAGLAPIHTLVLDITHAGAAGQVAERVGTLGPVDWLVNNAGIARIGPFSGSDIAAHVDQIHLNCEALVRLTDALLPAMVVRRRGIILNLASLSAFQPTPGFGIYGASKAFVLSLSEALGEELRGTGVQVSVLCTPPVTTEILDTGVPMGVPRGRMFGEITPDRCVRTALAQADRGRMLIFVHARDRVMAALPKLGPRGLVRRISRLIGPWYIGLPRLERLPPWRSTSAQTGTDPNLPNSSG